MKKIFLIISLTVTLAFLSCSSDDDTNSNCNSCVYNGETIEICSNGDNPYTVTAGDLKATITQSELDALELTPNEYVLLLCAAGEIDLED